MPADPLAALRAHAFELAGMAKSGLHFTDNEYDRARYDRAFIADIGLVTPKTGCSVAARDADGRLLLIRRADNSEWSLPGGYADIGSTPSANALRELREETGFEGEVERLLGVFDNRSFGSTYPYHFYILLFAARLVGGTATIGPETAAVGFFGPGDVPEDISSTQRAMISHAFAAPAAPAFQ